MLGPSIEVHDFYVCLATEGVQQSHSASAVSLITSSMPNLLLTRARPSSNCSLFYSVRRDWEKPHSIGVELNAHHRQNCLQPRLQTASLSSTLLMYRWLLVPVVRSTNYHEKENKPRIQRRTEFLSASNAPLISTRTRPRQH